MLPDIIIIVGGLDWCSFAPVTTLRYQKSAVRHNIYIFKLYD
jgi:hypothetical protein